MSKKPFYNSDKEKALDNYINCIRQCDMLPLDNKYDSCIESCERVYNYHTKCPFRHYYTFKERVIEEFQKLSGK